MGCLERGFLGGNGWKACQNPAKSVTFGRFSTQIASKRDDLGGKPVKSCTFGRLSPYPNRKQTVSKTKLRIKGDVKSVLKIYQCVKKFGAISGLEANLTKCSIFYGGVEDTIKNDIFNHIGFPEGVLPFKYLGLPLISKRLSYVDCNPLFQKISNQFQEWKKHRTLSYAGRLQIIKSIILGVQIFWTSCYVLPSKVLQKIDDLCRDFLWGRSDHSLKAPLVSWDKVCTGKNQGGLGIYSAITWNLATAMRTLWYVHSNKECLWIKWVHGTYLKESNIWQVRVKTGDSWLWKQLLKVRDKAVNLVGGTDMLIQIGYGNSC
ncbi:uncharacterized protein LOC109828080 [Asparagus officinalis]|uniref:uncharacterized protein LOC109828080 n=1 Tax=Asparagus officinalis TaxID=4686 RepID=UPI00098E67E4|nr:uncharacterized protein LOC109828080 [Asparagus officinalis]